MKEYTKEQIKAAQDALAIIATGASNSSGISYSLTEVYKAWLNAGSSTRETNSCAPAKLILDQLCQLAGMFTNITGKEFNEALHECRKIAKGEQNKDG